MAITISPNTDVVGVVDNPVCFQAVALRNLPQEDERYVDFPASGTNFTYDAGIGRYKKVSGTNGTPDAGVVGASVYSLQPFYIWGANSTYVTPAYPNNISGCYIGVFDGRTDLCPGAGCFYGWLVTKNCSDQPTGCSGPNGDNINNNWKAKVIDNTGAVVANFDVNFNERFRVRSDGLNLYWDIYSAGNIGGSGSPPGGAARWINALYTMPLPVADVFTFHANGSFVGNELSYITTFKGSYQGSLPLTWTAPLGGVITGEGGDRCFTSATPGTYQVCVDSDFDDPVCVDITISDLYFNPVDFDCGDCVFTGETVQFESNGGLDGVLTATSGTVLGALTWQAPGSPGTAILTYTLGGAHVDCEINIVEQPVVTNVVGDSITGLVPGEFFQINTNYGYPHIVWDNIDCPNIITPEGIVAIPKRLNDGCFGALDCFVRGRLVSVPGETCANLTDGSIFIDLRIIVDPVYPTPVFGGPIPLKWKPETPDFRVLINEFEGGCDETYLRNRVPIYRWMVRYDGIRYDNDNPCDPVPCCDEEQGSVNGYTKNFNVAKRLDDFWNLVAGNAGYFTMVDYRTGKTWRRVRFEGAMERDHINWFTTQSRTFTLVWHPCCATEPMGGVCQHNSTYDDNSSPSIPQNPTATALSYNKIFLKWDASTDNVGVTGYDVWIDGEIYSIPNQTAYIHKNLPPSSTFHYKVRAKDGSYNTSDWSVEFIGQTDDNDTEPPTIPSGFVATALSGTSIQLSWNASTDNIEVAGYKLVVDGVTIDVGDVLTYTHTGLVNCSKHTYFVRAYDTSGNQSGYSFKVIATSFCGEIYEGINQVFEALDDVREG